MNANALPGNAELVLENIQIEPPYPKKGELTVITGDVYNAGIVETDSLASIITAAYFVDDKLLFIDEIGNVKPGIGNKIKISSDPVWDAEVGNHNVKIIIDYHNTLNDQYDSFDDNIAEKTFSISSLNSTKILLTTSSPYVIQGKDTLLNISVSLEDSDSNKPLDGKNIILNFDGDDIYLTTDKYGKIFFSKTVNYSKALSVESNFEGDNQYLPSSSILTLHSIPKDITSAILVNIIDAKKQYNFENNSFEFLIFQDSYENLIKKISPTTTLLDSDTFWISLPAEHDYFAEVYLDGRFLFLTDKIQLNENDIVLEELVIPESAEVRFRVTNELGEPQSNVIVNNWIYSTITDENGFTDWIVVLPTSHANSYVAEVFLPNEITMQSNPFDVFSGEKKTIDIITMEIRTIYDIPDWIKNNAEWWAAGQIDDDSFVQGIQYLIKEDILKIPPTTQGSSSGSNDIPDWIKSNAEWWAAGQIDDTSFINAMQFLIKEGIVRIL
ncbi:MAG: hypothetical protein OER82_03340 [Nitrosopumilus sp.]|nr:hypothetical protein [Nitrosopumilus sp.]